MAALGVSRKKWPEHLVLVDEMAVTATGKLDKKAMAAHAANVLGRALEPDGGRLNSPGLPPKATEVLASGL